MKLHKELKSVTERIIERSRDTRQAYLQRCESMRLAGVQRGSLSCTNLAHVAAAMPDKAKGLLKQLQSPNIAIVTAYNDMLSAHQPYERFPAIIKQALIQAGATAQVAGGVPAMCDGITQGQPGMELSLFSRDVIALSTAVALSHNSFDGMLLLGICDKIVPGLLIGALQFGHLPALCVPAGPMASGKSNKDKSAMRQKFLEGKASREELLESESASYHAPGTCTFYGTANSNQLLLEVLGLHLPAAAFINPHSELRDELTKAAALRVCEMTALGSAYIPLSQIIDEKAIVNAVVALLATGGSTNHTIHLVAIARAAGIVLSWDDFDALSAIVPILARMYPNGSADVNDFQNAGGPGFLIRELLEAGYLHQDVYTVLGQGLDRHCKNPELETGTLVFKDAQKVSLSTEVLRPVKEPFSKEGGLKLLKGNIGKAVAKISAVDAKFQKITAPAKVFSSQEEVMQAFEQKLLDQDCVVVVRFQGPKANGMPELHQLNAALAVLQDKGFRVAIVTDGRMSGASGKILSAIHCTPEASSGGPLALIREGDLITIDATQGLLQAEVKAQEFSKRKPTPFVVAQGQTFGRNIFSTFRKVASPADEGGCSLFEEQLVVAAAPAKTSRRKKTKTEEVLEAESPG